MRRLSLAVSTTKSFDPQSGLATVGTGALLRSATVMSALRLPGGTAIAQSTLQAATTSSVAASLVGAAAEGRFVGGATLDDAKRTAAALAEDGIATIVDHGVEEADDVQLELARKRQLVAAADGLTVPIKPTAVADGAMLRALADLIQQAPEPDAARLDGELVTQLSEAHRESFEDAVEGLVRLARDAEAAGGALLLDAEMTDLQPAVDRLFLSALEAWAADSEKAFATYALRPARPGPPLYYTYQCYLSGSEARLALDAAAAKDLGVAFGAKLVRGDDRLKFAQILGLCDGLTRSLAAAGCRAHKLVLFGATRDLAPWIGRRLAENADALGAPAAEAPALWRELARRVVG